MNARVLANAWDDAVDILDAHARESGTSCLGGLPYAEMRDTIPALVGDVHDGARRIERIIADLKDFARPRAEGAHTTLQLNDAVQRALRLLAHLIKQRTDHLHVDLAQGLPSLRGDAQQVEQIVVNLLTNALEALPDRRHGVSVTTAFDAAERCVHARGARRRGRDSAGASRTPVRSVLHHQARERGDRPRSGHHLLACPRARGPTHLYVRAGQGHVCTGRLSMPRGGAAAPSNLAICSRGAIDTMTHVSALPVLLVDDDPQVLHSASIVLRTSGRARHRSHVANWRDTQD